MKILLVGRLLKILLGSDFPARHARKPRGAQPSAAACWIAGRLYNIPVCLVFPAPVANPPARCAQSRYQLVYHSQKTWRDLRANLPFWPVLLVKSNSTSLPTNSIAHSVRSTARCRSRLPRASGCPRRHGGTFWHMTLGRRGAKWHRARRGAVGAACRACAVTWHIARGTTA